MLLSLLWRIAAVLPLPLVWWCGRTLALVVLRRHSREYRVAQANIDACYPNQNARWRQQLCRAHIGEIGKGILECGVLWQQSATRLQQRWRFADDCQALIAQLRARRGGALLLLPHHGSWEAAGLMLSSHVTFTAMYKHDDRLPALVSTGRSRFGVTLVTANTAGVRQLTATISRGGIVCVLPDQVPPRHSGVWGNFLGQPAFTATFAPRLMAHYKPLTALVWAERDNGVFTLHGEQLPSEADVATNVATINAAIERCVRRRPTQYIWSYERFRAPRSRV